MGLIDKIVPHDENPHEFMSEEEQDEAAEIVQKAKKLDKPVQNKKLMRVGLMTALALALHNFPEGIAVAMPLRRQGASRFRSFWYGQLSAIVEPIAAVFGAVMVVYALPVLPYALAFAAGAMIYVVIEEVVPETQQDKFTDTSTIGFIIGFVVMMVLDVSLG